MEETLYMIHGMWGGAYQWDNYRAFFGAKGYRCIAPTLRYHDMAPSGIPDPRLGTVSLLDYASDLEEDIRALDDLPILVGHSMGGLLAQILAARGLAKKAVCLTPASPAGIFALRFSVIRSFWSGLARWGFWRKAYRQTFGEAAYSMLHLLDRGAQRAAYDAFVYESGRAAFEIGFWLLDGRHASRVDAGGISCPLLIVAGAQDRITPAAVTRKVAGKYGAMATYREFPDHAHWVIGEPGWRDVAACVAEWLEDA